MTASRAAEARTDSLDSLLGNAVSAGTIPGVVAAVSTPEKTTYLGAFGRARQDAPMNPDNVFRIASMTKLVTSIAILMLVEEGAIRLNMPLSDCLPGYREPDVLETFDHMTSTYSTRPSSRKITIGQLLTHTSGYGHAWLDRPLKALMAETPDYFNPPFLVHEPGTRFSYGTSTDVLGQVIEPVTGLSLEAFFRKRIFDPLGMHDTAYSPPRDMSRLVDIYSRAKASFIGEQEPRLGGVRPRGGGGLYSTAEDFSKLLRAMLSRGRYDGGKLLESRTVAAMTKNQIGDLFAEPPTTAYLARSNDFIFLDGTQKFGFGVAVESRDQSTGRTMGSYGWAGILNTYFWVDPFMEIAVTVLMQVRPFSDPRCVQVYHDFERALYDSLST